MLTLCTHVLVFTPKFADVLFTLSKHILGSNSFFIFTGSHFSHAYILQA